MSKSKDRNDSYEVCNGCAADCIHLGLIENEPCYGSVYRYDIGQEELHICDGHWYLWEGLPDNKYTPEEETVSIEPAYKCPICGVAIPEYEGHHCPLAPSTVIHKP